MCVWCLLKFKESTGYLVTQVMDGCEPLPNLGTLQEQISVVNHRATSYHSMMSVIRGQSHMGRVTRGCSRWETDRYATRSELGYRVYLVGIGNSRRVRGCGGKGKGKGENRKREERERQRLSLPKKEGQRAG